MDVIGAMVVGLDVRGYVLFLNTAAEHALGYSKDELLGRDWFDCVVPREKFPAVAEVFQRSVLGDFTRRMESEVITKSGERRVILWQNSPLKEQGKLVAIVATGMDITDRSAEENRRESIERRMLDAQKLESLGILAGGIAHDFNNLLTAVLGNASLMRLDLPSDSPHRPYLIEIERTALHAASLCKQMLAYAGQHTAVAAPVSLNELIHEMRQLLRVSVGKKVALNFHLAENLPMVEADDAQLRQVILNLVINASEAVGDNTGEINVTTRVREVKAGEFETARFSSSDCGGRYVELEVSDNGCGMNSETQKRIFDPFFTTKFTGRGLGLASVLGIVRGHRGILDIQSRELEGTRFQILLPAIAVETAQPLVINTDRSAVDWLGSGKILVVEDEDNVRSFAMRLLELLGFECIGAADGRAGLDEFLRLQNELRAVVLDLTMPRMNGTEVHAAIRALNPEIPILLVSGYTNAASASLQDPFTDFLQKPYQLSDIRMKLERLLKITQ